MPLSLLPQAAAAAFRACLRQFTLLCRELNPFGRERLVCGMPVAPRPFVNFPAMGVDACSPC
jgi:hypothetical protein